MLKKKLTNNESDFYFFETLTTKTEDQEVKGYFSHRLLWAEDPTKAWIETSKEMGKIIG